MAEPLYFVTILPGAIFHRIGLLRCRLRLPPRRPTDNEPRQRFAELPPELLPPRRMLSPAGTRSRGPQQIRTLSPCEPKGSCRSGRKRNQNVRFHSETFRRSEQRMVWHWVSRDARTVSPHPRRDLRLARKRPETLGSNVRAEASKSGR